MDEYVWNLTLTTGQKCTEVYGGTHAKDPYLQKKRGEIFTNAFFSNSDLGACFQVEPSHQTDGYTALGAYIDEQK